MSPNMVGNLWCNGEQSCAETTIRGINQLHASGTYALYFADIYSHVQNPNETWTLILKLTGKLAGYGANFTCLAGHKCKIFCEGHDSCHMFHIDCPGDCTVSLATAETIPPLTTHNITIPLAIAPIDTENVCTHAQALLSDGKNDYKSIEIVHGDGPVCCRGLGSCSYTNITITTSQSLVCSAGFSCRYSNIFMNNGAVHCEAGCLATNIYSASHLYCFEYQSCKDAVITSTRYIDCSGKSSCEGSIIHSAGTDLDVTFSANAGGLNAEIYCNAGDVCDVVCAGKSACLDATLYCYGQCTVSCDEESSCPTEITLNPTSATDAPTKSPTEMPSKDPSVSPSDPPSTTPSQQPKIQAMIPLYLRVRIQLLRQVVIPLASPSMDPTANPSDDPTVSPSQDPTATPSDDPTANPSNDPTASPTDDPSRTPTRSPSGYPSISPSGIPTVSPSNDPSEIPTISPSGVPSASPSNDPTVSPSKDPSRFPSASPVVTAHPTISPTTAYPSVTPSYGPTVSPSDNPTRSPSGHPSIAPSKVPTTSPSNNPSKAPVITGSADPTKSPINHPSAAPVITASPTVYPTASPSDHPSISPSASPSNDPSVSPTRHPSASPSNNPSQTPSYSIPSATPTIYPSKYATGTRMQITISITLTTCDDDCVITEEKVNHMIIAQLDHTTGAKLLRTEIVDNTVIISIVADTSVKLDKDVIASPFEAEYGELEVTIEEHEYEDSEDAQTHQNDEGLTSTLFLWGTIGFTFLAIAVLIGVLCRYCRKRKSSQKHTQMIAIENKGNGVNDTPGATPGCTAGGTTDGGAPVEQEEVKSGEESVSGTAEDVHVDDLSDTDNDSMYENADVDVRPMTATGGENQAKNEESDNESMYENANDDGHGIRTPETPGDVRPMTGTAGHTATGGCDNEESDHDSLYGGGDADNEPMTKGNTTTGGGEDV
eukprot:918994_1